MLEELNKLKSYTMNKPLGSVKLVKLKDKIEDKSSLQTLIKRDFSNPFIGREFELSELRRGYFKLKKQIQNSGKNDDKKMSPENGKQNRAYVIGIKGEAGIGKTRLVREFLKQNAKHYLTGNSENFVQSPYSLFLSLIRNQCKISQSDSVNVIKEKARYFYDDASNYFHGSALKKKFFGGFSILVYLLGIKSKDSRLQQSSNDIRIHIQITLREFIEALAVKSFFQKEPFVLVLEDLHWMDTASRNALAYIFNTINKSGQIPGNTLFLLLYRPVFTPGYEIESSCDFTEIELEAFDNESIDKLLRQHKKSKKEKVDIVSLLSEKTKTELYERSVGNPLFIQEWSKLIRDKFSKSELEVDNRGNIKTGKQDLEIPETVHSLVNFRIENLSEGEKEVIRIASVIGLEFTSGLLENVMKFTGCSADSGETLKQLIAGNFLKKSENSGESFKFNHDIIRDVVYNTIAGDNRRVLHFAAATVIEELYSDSKDNYIYQLAEHFGKTDSEDKAIEYFERAGDKARESFENEKAEEYYDRIIETVDSGIEKYFEVNLKKLHLLRHTGKWTSAIGISESLLNNKKVKLLPKYFLGINSIVAELYSAMGEYQKSIELSEKILKYSSDTGNQSFRLKIKGMLGRNYLMLGNISKSKKHNNDFFEDSKKNPDKNFLAKANNELGILNRMIGNFDEALNFYKDSLRLYEQAGNFVEANHVTSNIGSLYFYLNDYKKAIEYMERAVELNLKTGSLNAYANSLGNLGNAYFEVGNSNEARKKISKRLEISQQLNNKDGIAASYFSIASFYLVDGLYKEAMEFFQKALKIFEEINKKSSIANTKYNMGLINFCMGNYGEAMKYYSEQLEYYEENSIKEGMQRSYLNLANLHKKIGNSKIAEDYYQKAIALAKQSGAKRMIEASLFNYAEYFFDNKNYSDAERLNEEAFKYCMEDYKDDLFQISLLREKINYYSEFIKINFDLKNNFNNFAKLEKIIGRTEALLKSASGEEQKGILNYEIWKMKRTKEQTNPKGISHYRKTALSIFEKLYKVTPNMEYQSIILELKN